MSKLYDSLNGGSVAGQKKKKMTITAIYVTVVLVVLALAVFTVSVIVASVKDKAPVDEGGGDGTGRVGTSYTTVSLTSTDLHTGNLLLVNKEYIYDFDANSKNSLIKIADYIKDKDETETTYFTPRDSTVQADETALAALDEFITAFVNSPVSKDENAATVRDARTITISDAYRSLAEQNNNPGYSDHHTGMLFALKDKDKADEIKKSNTTYTWLYENAYKYGFIMRYPSDKKSLTGITYEYENAFRYVGVAHATYIYENELCLEEYINLLNDGSHTSSSPLKISGGDGNNYEVYYTAANPDGSTDVNVPTKYSYTVSGDNTAGYIVTVNKSKTK